MKKILLFLIVILSQFLLRTAAYSGRFSATEDGLLATALSALKQDPNYQSAANYAILYDKVVPFSGSYTFHESDNNVSSGISAKLYDSLGNQKASFNLINNAATIDINHLPAGVYYLKILIGNKLESHTVIKQ